jgi:chemotaxis protein MotB
VIIMQIRIAFLAVVAIVLSGCVSSGTFDKKAAELSACQDERLAMQAKAKTELDTSFAAQLELEAGLQGMKSEYEACKQTAEAARKNEGMLKQREADLRERLQTELTDKDVEISSLRGQLSVSVLDKILFKSGSADILPAGLVVLEKVTKVLAQTDDMIRVEGHTDNVPISGKLKDKYFSNWELSAARAASVVRYFQQGENKIDPARMEAVGFAEYHPLAPNDSDENRRRNRRVEIVLTAVKPPIEAAPASATTPKPVSAPAPAPAARPAP